MKPIPSPVGKDALDMLRKAEQLLQKAEKLEMVEHDGKKVPHFAADGKGTKDMKAKADMATKDKYCMENFGKQYSECSKKQKAQCDRVHGKVEKAEGHEEKIVACLKKKGGAASLEECAKACGISPEECKKVIAGMDNVQTSKHGDIVLTDGLSDEELEKAGCMPSHKKEKKGKVKKGFDAGSQPGFTTSYDSNPMGVMFLAESGGQTRNAYYTTNQYPYNAQDVANKGSTSESFNMESISGQMNPHDGGGVDRQVENGVLSKAQAALAKAKEDVLKAVCRQCGGNQFSGCKLGFGDDCPGLEGTTEIGEMVDDERYDPSEYMRTQY